MATSPEGSEEPSADGAKPPQEGRALLELINVSKVFPTTPPVNALSDVNVRILAGQYVAIEGQSGSGKSTLLNVLGCLDRHTSGTYLFDGIDTSELDDSERAELRGNRIGFVFQAFHLLAHRTVLENVMLGELYLANPRPERKKEALKCLDQVGMNHRTSFLPTRLSGGERQRVAIARALMGDPGVLLCDEPTGNLDTKNSEMVLDLVDALVARGITVLVITHESSVSKRAQRRLRIVDGFVSEAAEAVQAVEAVEAGT